MGFIIDTGVENLGLERRKESFYIYELEGEDVNRDKEKCEIFSFGINGTHKSPTLEITKPFLKKIIKYFNEHPGELEDEYE